MKRKYSYFDGKKQTEREYSYIPFRYILAVFIALLEVLAVICTDYTCCRFYAILYVLFPYAEKEISKTAERYEAAYLSTK